MRHLISCSFALLLLTLSFSNSLAATLKNREQQPKRKAPRTLKKEVITVRDIREVEQRLADLGYWTGPIDGKFDEATRHALIAFQKVTGRSRTGRLTRIERSAVMRASHPEPREGGPTHIEVDLQRQVLFIVNDDGVITKILPVSTGSGKDFYAEGWTRTAITPPGRFNIQSKTIGWKKSALGRLYYPNYIIGGIAIHGYPSIPTTPASHGCIRIPMFAAKEFSRISTIGTTVLVYDSKLVASTLCG